MKALIISYNFWPYGSGGQLATYLYSTLLTMKGLKVIVIVGNYNSLFESYNFKVVSLPYIGFGKYTIYIGKKMLKKLIEWTDIVYFSFASPNLIPFVRRLGKPIIVHLHSYDSVCPVGSLYNFVLNSICNPKNRTCSKCIWLYERYQARNLIHLIGSVALNSLSKEFLARSLGCVDALIFVSNTHRDFFLKHLESILDSYIPSTYVIYNPIPEIRYIPPSEFNVGYFSGPNLLKGYHFLLRAWLKTWSKYRDAKLFATKMAKFANDKTLEKVNVIAYGRLNLKEFGKLWSRIGVVVFPSIWQEPFPYVVVETLLHGRLLIASRVGGVPEAIGGAPGVRLVPPGDVDALADALEWALSMDKENVVELGLKNREHALKKYNNERSIKELIRVFSRVLKEV